MRKKLFIIIYAIITVIFVLFQIFKYDLVIAADKTSFGLGIGVGLLDYFMYMIYAVLIIISIIYAIIRTRTKKWKAFIPIFLCVVVIFFGFIFPTTGLYLNLNYNINKEIRTTAIKMYNEGTLPVIGMNEYKVSGQASYTGIIFTQKNGDTIKIMFWAYKGLWANKVFIYVSDDSGIKTHDFNPDKISSEDIKFENIQRVSENWYSANIK